MGSRQADFRNGKLRAVGALGHPRQGAAATIAGAAGVGMEDGDATASKIYKATGVALDRPTGRLYFTDQFNHRIRRVAVPKSPHQVHQARRAQDVAGGSTVDAVGAGIMNNKAAVVAGGCLLLACLARCLCRTRRPKAD